MQIAKALVLAASGDGGRPSANGPAGCRHLFPIANRPILFHNLEALRTVGVQQVAILADPVGASEIHRAVGDGGTWGMDVRIADWDASVGLRGALAAGHDLLGDEPVLVQEGDALLREHMEPHFAAFEREGLDALALRLRTADGRLADVRTPGYVLGPRAVSILLECRARNPVAGVRAGGGNVRVQHVDGCFARHGDVDSLLDCNRRMLEGLEGEFDPSRFTECTIQGRVNVDPTARVERTLLRGPVIIGPGARVTDAYIGPYSSIGAGAVIEGAEIEHSIVLSEAELRFVGTRIESSVVGRGARIVRGFDLPGAIRVSIGDGAEVVLR